MGINSVDSCMLANSRKQFLTNFGSDLQVWKMISVRYWRVSHPCYSPVILEPKNQEEAKLWVDLRSLDYSESKLVTKYKSVMEGVSDVIEMANLGAHGQRHMLGDYLI